MDKLNPEIKSKWVAALRSGEFQQVTGKLHNLWMNSYCCLGVLCALSDNFTFTLGGFSAIGPNNQIVSVDAFLIDAGITDTDAAGKIANTLIGMNDTYGRSFTEIADYIDENL
jgi:hypothetical protein